MKIAPHCICILCVRQYKMNSQLNKVAAICALVIVATYVFQGQANPLGIPSYQFGVEVPLYRIKLPAFAIGNILFALSVRWVWEFLSLKYFGRKLVLIYIKISAPLSLYSLNDTISRKLQDAKIFWAENNFFVIVFL